MTDMEILINRYNNRDFQEASDLMSECLKPCLDPRELENKSISNLLERLDDFNACCDGIVHRIKSMQSRIRPQLLRLTKEARKTIAFEKKELNKTKISRSSMYQATSFLFTKIVVGIDSEHLSCPICLNEYVLNTTRLARFDECGHIICEKCLGKYKKHDRETCSICRASVKKQKV